MPPDDPRPSPGHPRLPMVAAPRAPCEWRARSPGGRDSFPLTAALPSLTSCSYDLALPSHLRSWRCADWAAGLHPGGRAVGLQGAEVSDPGAAAERHLSAARVQPGTPQFRRGPWGRARGRVAGGGGRPGLGTLRRERSSESPGGSPPLPYSLSW